ncbi:cbb3-type cytochrome c oxidase subunit I [Sphingosinicella sp. YJ22]|uniref:cbb3-type cytochrome c oxidase subunit I n=1 Tax=Sphingosinicella sp. YJ22 TaxID=1104780 RepID=UPI00140E1547|nr:cbb3-type cytochrome c oxidase subunit I [Sphingosinicella sp. YJ22]
MSSETGFDPALYERFPTTGERPAGEFDELNRIWAAPTGIAKLTAVNNNYVGVWYIATAFLFFVLAGVLALVMRAQLALPLQGILPQETYNQFFTMHGTIMMFLFAVPIMEALGVLLLPQMLAARDLPFPRLSAYAFWAYFVGGLCFFASIFFGLAPNGGWFMYPPLTSTTYSPGINADFWLLGIGFIEISAIAGAIEIIVGVLRTRAPGMSLREMPIFAWGMLVFAGMIVIAFPSVILATLLLELERALNWPFFDPTRGGDPVLWQHLFWFFGHPEVYIIFLPASALVSMMIPALARTRLVGHNLIVLAFLATGFISFGVWAHHMFATGMPALSVGFFAAASMAVSVPAGIQVFSWIATFASGKPVFNTPTLFVLGGLVTFVIGGLTGVMVALVPFDWQVHDTHFIVAHLHYVLIGGAVFPLFAVFYYWMGMTSRRPLSERTGKWVFWLMFVGMQVIFLPMHLTGLMGMPRRVYTYLPGRDWEITNMISTIGAFIFAAGVLLFLIELARNFRFTVEDDAGNVYGGGTLEWLPTGLYSTRSIPVVNSRYPLWDDPGICKDVEEGRYFLPNAPTGHRETIITSPVRAEPEYVQIMPGPSAWPLLAAVFTAGFFVILTIQAYGVALFSGVLAVLCVLRWLWDTDRPIAVEQADVGAGIMLPTYVTGPRTHGWWAMIVLLVVIGMIFLMAVFSYFYLYGIHPQFWMVEAQGWWLFPIVGLYALAALLAWLGRRLLAREDVSEWTPSGLLLWGMVAAGAAFILDLWSWRATGLTGDASGQGAIIHALFTLQGCLVFILALMAVYLAARTGRALIIKPCNNTFDLITLFTWYLAGQGAASALLTRLVPGGF